MVVSSSLSEYSGILTIGETLSLSCSMSLLLLGWESRPGVNHIGKCGKLPKDDYPATAFLRDKNTYLDISLLSVIFPPQILIKALSTNLGQRDKES